MTDSNWQEITVRAPQSQDMSMLGRAARPKGKLDRDTRPMPLPSATALKEAAHARCVDHVKVPGLSKKVCILSGQDPEAVIAEARDLAGIE